MWFDISFVPRTVYTIYLTVTSPNDQNCQVWIQCLSIAKICHIMWMTKVKLNYTYDVLYRGKSTWNTQFSVMNEHFLLVHSVSPPPACSSLCPLLTTLYLNIQFSNQIVVPSINLRHGLPFKKNCSINSTAFILINKRTRRQFLAIKC